MSSLDIVLLKPVTNVEGQFEWPGMNEGDREGQS